MKGPSPKYLTSCLQLHNNQIHQARSTAKNIVKQIASRTVNFDNTFFPRCSQKWNNLSDDHYSNQYNLKKHYLTSSRPPKIPFLQFMTITALNDSHLRLNFSHLNEDKFRHNFLDTINPMCICGSEPETTAHFLLR